MITLNNISKQYNTKKSVSISALKNINLMLPSSGLIFICGQSGSGKTTLMNIIGGLDTPSDGEIIFLDKKFTNKSQDLEDFRNKYVSFVFQDYNIIDELNVKDNLTLGLTFQTNKIDDDIISKSLESVMLKGYENRYPNELSGGQIQRVAIARALLKNSKILLADEPTGNLDKTTGIEIMKVLKEISKNKLVLVVTHNEELANNYGDRIIKIEDGQVISDKGNKNIAEETETYTTHDKKRFSNRIAFKMGFHNLALKKFKLMITVLLMMLSYASIALTLAVFSYHYADPHTKLIQTREYEYFRLSNVSYYDLQKLNQKYPNINYIKEAHYPVITSKQDVINYGLELYPESLELTPNSYYISESFLYLLYNSGAIAIIDDEEVSLDYEQHPFVSLIGQSIKGMNVGSTIAGIYKSPFQNRPSDKDEKADDYIYDFYLSSFFSEENPFQSVNVHSGSINDKLKVFGSYNNIQTEIEQTEFSFPDNLNNYLIANEENIINNIQLFDNEIYLTLKDYNNIFGESFTDSYYLEKQFVFDPDQGMDIEKVILKNKLKHVGKEIEIQIYNKTYNQYETFNLKVKGVIFQQFNSLILMNENTYKKIAPYATIYRLNINAESVSDLYDFLHYCVNNYKVEIDTPITRPQSSFEDTLENIKVVMFLICIILVFIVLLQTISLISQSIYARKKEIGILKSMGARNKDIRKIYISENLILSFPIYIIAVIFSIIIVNFINYGFVEQYSNDFTFIYYKGFIAFVTLGAILVLNMIGTILPLYKINRMKPIDAIRK